ncbi:MAG: GTP cyclohydrolase I [Microbacterium ginsengisoli]|jgi:GTP cyclohydrolase IA|uniref:GTP cyclohydrolase I n=1 Tax=Microbacterium TaxID=33882 RepID=UPI0006F32B7E|nr:MULTISPECIES: GTP cyclohydrolase I [unclassified Microbacterium]KQR91640.1 GTP cyclohydrolase I [Microbacterium sp. Leaf347]KQR91730.1 GTP cyclohydrolase I [Microbacterium sp. Leaf351]MBN9197887.1 GTP cyclohydrolase I [Microbacterium ginsengisoli]OJU79224.1 MAG: GTP cyclohydrolase I FolE [Microbacterium sp. 71-23]
MAVDRARVAALVRELLEAIGENPDRPGLRQTPERVADAYGEFFAGVDADPAAALSRTISISRGPAPDTLPSGAVMLRDIDFRSVCEHHLLPFRGRAHLAYLPAEKVVGLGALPRVVEVLSARPQVQERLGEQIADTIADGLDARGVLVVLDAVHGCVTSRGERQPDASTVTIAARGALAEPAARAELIALIGAHR